MEYDEIDQYVDQLFRNAENRSTAGPAANPPVGNGDWRLDRIDQVINDAYEEALRWHNARIAEGTDPRSGLRSLPYIPWDERIDGPAAALGMAGAYVDSSYERNGGRWRAYGSPLAETAEARPPGLTCAEALLILGVGLFLLLFMMLNS